MPDDQIEPSTLDWLTGIEARITELETQSWIAYDNAVTAAPLEAPRRYLVYAKAHERLRTIQTAIIEVLKKRIVVVPPTSQDVAETSQLLDQLQSRITSIDHTTANLALFSSVFNIIDRRFSG